MNTTGMPLPSTPPSPAAGGPLPPPAPPGAPWRLVRGRNNVLAGVCRGLAVATGLNVTLVRAAFVIAGLTGVGVVAYLVLALVLPREDPAGPVLAPAPPDTSRWLRIGLLVGVVLSVTGVLGGSWHGPFLFGHFGGGAGFGILLIALGLFVVWIRRRDDERPAGPGGGLAPPVGPSGPQAGSSADAISAGPADAEATTVVPATWWAAPSPAGPAAVDPAVGPPARSRSVAVVAARVIVWLAVIGAIVTVAATIGLQRIGALSIPKPVVLYGSAVLAIGVVIATAIFVKSALPILASIAVLLVPVVLGVSMASWNGGVGNRLVAPASLAATNDYRLAIGQLTVDLTSAPLDGRDVNVSAETKIGDLAVLVAPDAAVVVDSHVGAGHSNVLGHDHSGLNVTDHVTDTPATASGTIHLDLDTAVGQLTVCRVPTGAQVVTRRCESVLARR